MPILNLTNRLIFSVHAGKMYCGELVAYHDQHGKLQHQWFGDVWGRVYRDQACTRKLNNYANLSLERIASDQCPRMLE